jgi:putative tryptophan/tyrosine transport system substrate-binding protein
VAIEYRLAENQIERLSALATELVRRQVAAIAGPITSALVARAATTTISIVFVAGEDPVTLSLMTSLARPGGNVTGINIFANELAAKRLELLREQVPEATRVAVLVNPANPATAELTARDVQAARGIGSQVEVLDASTSREIDGAFATAFFREPPDAFFVGGDSLFGRRQTI